MIRKSLRLFIWISLVISLFSFSCSTSIAQPPQKDSFNYDYSKLMSYALDANIASLLENFNTADSSLLTARSKRFKESFVKRFGNDEDKSDYMEKRKSPLDTLLGMYTSYWRMAFLNPAKNFDSLLLAKLSEFFANRYKLTSPLSRDTLESLYKKHITDAGYYSTAFGKTGRLFDLLVWKKQTDTVYNFKVKDQKIKTPVIFMDEFLTLGWTEYATMDRHYPGGWAKTNALYVVKKAYDLKSESFTVSYLAHEGTHFTDYKRFPKLSGIDNEYRAKLIELSIARASLFNLVDFFTKNSNSASSNPHALANFFVIRDLSKEIFQNEFEKDLEKWKKVGIEVINKTAYTLYKKNTKLLRKQPKDIHRFMK